MKLKQGNKELLVAKYMLIILGVLAMFFVVFFIGVETGKTQSTKINVQNKEIVLKPCPMCGHSVKLCPINDAFYIECDQWHNGGCGLKTGFYDDIDKLIEQWNRVER